jgi:hypothetical protein
MQGETHERPVGGREYEETERKLVEGFLSRPRRIPKRPQWSRTSIVIIRKEALPFYFAVYDHDLSRFVELQYRSGPNASLRSVHLPDTMQPPPIGQGPVRSAE